MVLDCLLIHWDIGYNKLHHNQIKNFELFLCKNSSWNKLNSDVNVTCSHQIASMNTYDSVYFNFCFMEME